MFVVDQIAHPEFTALQHHRMLAPHLLHHGHTDLLYGQLNPVGAICFSPETLKHVEGVKRVAGRHGVGLVV